MKVEQNINLIDKILKPYIDTIGTDFLGYKNHVYRMVNFCFILSDNDTIERQKIIIAACFHDIGIWLNKTIDYIPPSIPPMLDYLKKNNLEHWQEEIRLMIEEHHKLTKYKNPNFPLVEKFRKGDLVDFSLGLIKFGIPKLFIEEVKSSFPNAGFHKGLFKKIFIWILKHPLKPAPMLKW